MNDERMPWYMWLVLFGALGMSAPGEYHLAVVAGWIPAVAWAMPVVVSVYGAVAAYIAKKMQKGTPERRSAAAGALMALTLALAFQMTAHLMAAGYVHKSALLVAAVSATPPVVVAHLMHLPRPVADAARRSAAAKGKAVVAVATAAASNGRAVGTATGSEALEVAAVAPVAVTVATEDSTAGLETDAGAVAAAAGGDQAPKVTARPEAVTDAPKPPGAMEAVDAVTNEPETLPGLALVTTGGQLAEAATSGRGRSGTRGRVPDADAVRAAVADLEARGQAVTGRALAEVFDVSERTGRRYLAEAMAA